MRKNGKRIAALICVIILVGLYIATLVVSLLDFPGADRLLSGCIFATIGMPILLWIYIWIYGKVTNRPTFTTDFESAEEDTTEEH